MTPDEAAELALIEVSRWQREAMGKHIKLTDEEHETRAMLMGAEFMAALGVYYMANPPTYLDADTMEPLNLPELRLRIHQSDEIEFHMAVTKGWI